MQVKLVTIFDQSRSNAN